MSKTNPLLVIASIIGLVMANHRSGYLVIGLLVFITILVRTRKSSLVKMYSGAALLCCVSIVVIWQVPLLRDNFFSRIATSVDLTDQNAEFLLGSWALAAAHFLNNPIIGSGLKNQFYDPSIPLEFPPHNWVLEVLPTQGVIGFLFYACIFYLVLKIAWTNRNDPVSWQMILAVVFYLAFCLANANFLIKWNICLLAYPCALILYRNKELHQEIMQHPASVG
jgi:O-antigen ligase